MKARGATEKRRNAQIAELGKTVDEVWDVSEARACVKTITQAIPALHNHELHLSDSDGATRDLAEALGVPFFVVWLASENYLINEDIADLDDIEEGLRWLTEHKVPRDLLRRKRPRREEWQEKVDQHNAEIEKREAK